MVGVLSPLIRMKLAVMRHSMGGTRGILMATGGAIGLLLAAGTIWLATLRPDHPTALSDVLAVVFAMWTLGWVLGPLSGGGQPVLRASHFALLSISRLRLAVGLIRETRPQEGERVLVEAAGGGVGSLLVQLAKRAGATVVAAAGGERKLELARGLGADVTVDYRDPGWAEAVRREVGEGGLEVVFDSVGGDVGREAFGLLAGGGRFAVFGFASGAATEATFAEILGKGVTVIGYGGARPWPYPEYPHELEAEALREAAAGRLKPTIGQRFPLERAAEDHAAVEARATVGKTLLVP